MHQVINQSLMGADAWLAEHAALQLSRVDEA